MTATAASSGGNVVLGIAEGRASRLVSSEPDGSGRRVVVSGLDVTAPVCRRPGGVIAFVSGGVLSEVPDA